MGVEPICAELQVAPTTYDDTKSRPPSARARRDAELGPALVQLWRHNYSVYGRRKLTKTARRAGHDVGRDQVARLMRHKGIRGASRAKKRFTTMTTLPEQLRRSLTWDRSKELSAHAAFKVETGIPVYFADPRSPWQRGSNEKHQRPAPPILPEGHRPVPME
jgi:hypothetical protein